MGNTDSPRYGKEHRREADLTDGDGKETQDVHESKWEETPGAPWFVEAAKTLTFKVSYESRKKA